MNAVAPQLFDPSRRDRNAMRAARLRAKAEKGRDSDLLVRLAEDLADRFATITRRFSSILVVGEDSPAIRAVLLAHNPEADIRFVPVGADERLDTEAGGSDLVVALQVFHAVNDLPGLLIQCRRALRPDGLLIASLCGAGTLSELRDVLIETDAAHFGGAAMRVAPFADIRDLGGLMQRAGFALPVTDADTLTIRHGNLFALVGDLREHGCNSALASAPKPGNRSYWMEAAERYATRFADPDGRIRMTLTILWLSGWAPSDSQPKPLKPGSAKVSLASVLKPANDESGS